MRNKNFIEQIISLFKGLLAFQGYPHNEFAKDHDIDYTNFSSAINGSNVITKKTAEVIDDYLKRNLCMLETQIEQHKKNNVKLTDLMSERKFFLKSEVESFARKQNVELKKAKPGQKYI